MPSKSGHIVIPPPLHPPPSNSKDAIPTQSTSLIPPKLQWSLLTRVCHHLMPTLQKSWHKLKMKHCSISKPLLWQAVVKTEWQCHNQTMSYCCFLIIIAASSIKQEQNLTLHAGRYIITLAQFKIFHYSPLHACENVNVTECTEIMKRKKAPLKHGYQQLLTFHGAQASKMKSSKSKSSWVLRGKHR